MCDITDYISNNEWQIFLWRGSTDGLARKFFTQKVQYTVVGKNKQRRLCKTQRYTTLRRSIRRSGRSLNYGAKYEIKKRNDCNGCSITEYNTESMIQRIRTRLLINVHKKTDKATHSTHKTPANPQAQNPKNENSLYWHQA